MDEDKEVVRHLLNVDYGLEEPYPDDIEREFEADFEAIVYRLFDLDGSL